MDHETEQRAGEAPLLQVSDLSVRFGGREAVRSVSLRIGAGETLGLVGESGSGKSVTSLALMRLLGGGAEVHGRALLRVPGHAAGRKDGPAAEIDLLQLAEPAMRGHRGRSLAMIFQEPMTALNPVMTIGRQIGEAVEAHHPGVRRAELRKRVIASLEEVALPDPERRLRDYPHQFSGGQRQRIVIAMALINRPRLIIADEPTTALDVTVQAQILELLRRLRAEHGCGMLFISHDLAVVGQIADRIAVMRHGQVLEEGPSHRMLTRPGHPYTQALLRAAPTMTTDRERPLLERMG